MRLFVAVWPPAEVVAALAAIERPGVDGVRWTTEDQWHVTLRFLGDIEGTATVAARLRAAAPASGVAVVGPVSRRLGEGVLCLPVAGLDELAAAAVTATADIGAPPDRRPFFGHVTLARLRRGAHPASLRRLGEIRVSGSWPVEELTLVCSRLAGSGARYEVVERVPCR